MRGPDRGLPRLLVGFAVGGDDAPGRFDLDLLFNGENGIETGALLVGEQTGARVQCAACPIGRVAGPAPMTESVLLNALPCPIEGVAGEADDVERIYEVGLLCEESIIVSR